MKFLYLHEYYHIANGHVDLEFLVNKTSSWNEIDILNEEVTLFNLLDIQTLEMDADCCAVCTGIQEVLAFNKRFELLSEPFIQSCFSDLNKCTLLWMFAVYSFFRISGFDSKKYTKTNLGNFKHPPPGVRQHYVFSTLDAFFEKNKLDMHEKLLELSKTTILSVEKAFDEISEQGYDTSQIKFAMDQDVYQHGVRIIENWNNIRPLLEKYAYCNLAPLNS